MNYEAIAGRYARALFELGVETGKLKKLVDEVSLFADTYASSGELRAVLGNPLVSQHNREALIAELGGRLGLGDVSRSAIRLLANRNRLVILPVIARTLHKMSDDRDGVVRATVVSAKALSDSYAQDLQRALEKMTGRKVLLTREVDTSLIAGVVTRIGDAVIDGSLRARLDELRYRLLAN